MTKTVVVIGGGQSAASFIARFRQNDQQSKVVLISDEPVLPYQRPPLSKKFATGEMSKEQLFLRPQDWYEQNDVELRLGTSVKSLDPVSKSLRLSDDDTIHFDQAFLATGSRARTMPDTIGGGLPGTYVLRDLAHAEAFSHELVAGRRVVIIGGGYIGLEASAVCASKSLEVTLVEASDRILQRVACPETSEWFRKLHEDHGVTIHEAKGLKRFEETDGRVSAAILGDGSRIEVDFALIGIGIIPNAELASDAGFEVEGGIVVDAHCRTSDPDIFAAGDCAAFQYKGHLTRLESVQNAIDQAECAADNMTGNDREYEPFPWFWSDQYDVKLQIAGLNRGYDTIVVRPGERDGALSHFYFSGDTFLAVDAMNDPRTYMVGKKLLESGKNITPDQAADSELQLKSLL